MNDEAKQEHFRTLKRLGGVVRARDDVLLKVKRKKITAS